jgi:ribonuclease-3
MNFLQKILQSRTYQNGNFFLDFIKKIIGSIPKNSIVYYHAFIHRSMNKRDENGHTISYERLEYLGDVMLNAVISDYLYGEVPYANEGYLTNMRSKIISRKHLNEIGKNLNLVQFLQSHVPDNNFGENIHGNVFEALVGAVYLDKGFDYCKNFVHKRVIEPYVNIEQLEGRIISYKSLMIEWCQKHHTPFYFKTYEDTGNDTVKHFAVKFYMNHEVVAKARATSKKRAEERAAKRAYFSLQRQIDVTLK